MSYTSDHDAEDRKAAERGAGGDPASHPGAGALQDKAAINAGLSGDKVAGMDLAASPLGTDDEAGGDAAARDTPRGPAVSTARDPDRANAAPPRAPWVWLLAALVAAVLLGFALLAALD